MFHRRRFAIAAAVFVGAILALPEISHPVSVRAADVEPSSILFIDDLGRGVMNGAAVTVSAPDTAHIGGSAAIDNGAPGERLTFDVDPLDDARFPQSWGMQFHAPEGEVLHPGTYLSTTPYDDGEGLAFFTLNGNGYGCPAPTPGSFTVHEISVDPVTGDPLVFAATFEIYCGEDVERGEFRMNSTVPVTSRDVTPLALDFDIVQVGSTGPSSPVTVTNTGNGPLHMGHATVEGPFTITDDECAGSTLTGHDTCQIHVASTPTGPQGSSGWLSIHDDSVGDGHRIYLSGEGRVDTTTTLTSSKNPSVFLSEPTTLTISVEPKPNDGYVQLCVVGGTCGTQRRILGGKVTMSGNPSATISWYAKYLGAPDYNASQSAVLIQEVGYRPDLRITASQTSMTPGHPVWLEAGMASGSIPGGTLTIYDDLTDQVVGTASPGHGYANCLRPTEIGTHTYRIAYSGFEDDWLPTAETIDVVVGELADVLPARIPGGSFGPSIQCATLVGAPTHTTNQTTIQVTPLATTQVILTEVRMSNSPDVDVSSHLIHGVLFPYGQPISWSLIDLLTGHGDADGQVQVSYQFKGDNGLWGSVWTTWVTLDRTVPVPTATAPKLTIPSGTTATSGKVAISLAWTVASAGNGVDHVDLEQATDGGPWLPVETPSTTVGAVVLLSPQHQYQFRVRAVDADDNAGGWATGTAVSLKLASESSSLVSYSGTWKKVSHASYWGDKAKTASKGGAKASIKVSARGIAWVSRLGPTRGKAKVYVDGDYVATVNLYRSTALGPRIVWSKTWAKAGTHRVTVRVSGTSGHPSVLVDGFLTLK